MLATVLIGIQITVLLGSVIMLIANNKTYNQRIEIMPKAADPDFWNKMQVFDSVSYNRHLWYLITLRNPYNLYQYSRILPKDSK